MSQCPDRRRFRFLHRLAVPCLALLVIVVAGVPATFVSAGDPPKGNASALKIKPDSPGASDDAAVMEGPAMAKPGEDSTAGKMSADTGMDADQRKERVKKRLQEREIADRKLIQSILGPRPTKVVKPASLTSAELDSLVDAFLAAGKAPPATQTLDTEFVRRIYLDLTGKPPTSDQARAFVNSSERSKRGKLIEVLLNSPEYAENWARYWADVIRYHATNANVARLGFEELEKWLKGEIAANKPWDEIATALITATGRTDLNGATVLDFAHEAQAVEVAGEVSRIFMGIQIQCAQCHDHPTDSWKRKQFHEFASFFAGTRVRRVSDPMERPVLFEVFGQPAPRYTMPDLKDPAKMIQVAPKFFLAADSKSTEESSKSLPMNLSATTRRELVASYITGQDNPWFARAYVNRIWQVLVGEGFYMPVDDLGPERTAKAPEVLDALAFQNHFELKSLSTRDPLDLFGVGTRHVRLERAKPVARRPDFRLTRPCPRSSPQWSGTGTGTRSDFRRVEEEKRARGGTQGNRRQDEGGSACVHATNRVQCSLRRRSLDCLRRRVGDDSAGPFPDEQPDPQPLD